ncbi:MAG: type III PLP-dependent enzyme [Alphaproteobacteria bacterium]|jgi:ornithine decarboxylase
MTPRIETFLADQRPATPCLVMDLDMVRDNYLALARSLPQARIFYAMKANPAPQIMGMLAEMGSSFDTASIYEIREALAAGAPASRISFGNTVKKQSDIAAAYALGVRLFAFDSQGELEKLAVAAPGAKVYCRLRFEKSKTADWPLGGKFGCSLAMAEELLVSAGQMGLDPYGLSFHVGSQQRDAGEWDVAVGKAAMLFTSLRERGVNLRLLNVGGGLPGHYLTEAASHEEHASALTAALHKHFGNRLPEVLIEPGRSLVADAGMIRSEVVLVSHKMEDGPRWVYLDVGKFGGLIETMDEAIKYRIRTSKDGQGDTSRVIIAGPTCDEVDVLYQETAYNLPDDLKPGDTVDFLSAGAYTSTYCSVAFNGLPPLKTYCV